MSYWRRYNEPTHTTTTQAQHIYTTKVLKFRLPQTVIFLPHLRKNPSMMRIPLRLGNGTKLKPCGKLRNYLQPILTTTTHTTFGPQSTSGHLKPTKPMRIQPINWVMLMLILLQHWKLISAGYTNCPWRKRRSTMDERYRD